MITSKILIPEENKLNFFIVLKGAHPLLVNKTNILTVLNGAHPLGGQYGVLYCSITVRTTLNWFLDSLSMTLRENLNLPFVQSLINPFPKHSCNPFITQLD